MSADVFISFASQDRKVALTLCSALETRGFSCWISGRDILPGENFQVAIVRAIRQARIMLLVFTANSNNSEEMTKELALASQHKLMVVPLRIEDVTPNDAFAYEFATRQWIDFFADWEAAIQQLAQRIEWALKRDPAPAPVAASPQPVRTAARAAKKPARAAAKRAAPAAPASSARIAEPARAVAETAPAAKVTPARARPAAKRKVRRVEPVLAAEAEAAPVGVEAPASDVPLAKLFPNLFTPDGRVVTPAPLDESDAAEPLGLAEVEASPADADAGTGRPSTGAAAKPSRRGLYVGLGAAGVAALVAAIAIPALTGGRSEARTEPAVQLAAPQPAPPPLTPVPETAPPAAAAPIQTAAASVPSAGAVAAETAAADAAATTPRPAPRPRKPKAEARSEPAPIRHAQTDVPY